MLVNKIQRQFSFHCLTTGFFQINKFNVYKSDNIFEINDVSF
jgi:hypothetical protein